MRYAYVLLPCRSCSVFEFSRCVLFLVARLVDSAALLASNASVLCLDRLPHLLIFEH
jgi:hypothetical protein